MGRSYGPNVWRRFVAPFAAAWFAAVCPVHLPAAELSELTAQVCVVGGGSGGFGAALAAARAGASVVLVEQTSRLGGTSTGAFVSSWEPGPGDDVAKELYQRLRQQNAAGVTRDTNPDRKQGRFGLWQVDPNVGYEASLRRAGRPRRDWHGVAFEPEAMSRLMAEMLAETGKCNVLFGRRFVSAKVEDRRVAAVEAVGPDGAVCRIRAGVFIDSTGNVDLCRAAGCEIMLGPDPRSRFDEPSAPEKPDRNLNAISWCYRLRKSDHPATPPAPESPVKRWPHSAHVVELPSGDRLVNPLGLFPGRMLIDLGYDKTKAACKPIVQAHWQWLHGQPAFAQYELESLAPVLGIRESHRVVGEYVLTQHDLLAGLAKQTHADLVALADHSMDIHGSGRASICKELPAPYGVPYRCLVPKGMENLLVACRGASFSQIAASSCRLSRTILALGHAAGLGAAQAVKTGVPVGKVNVELLRKELRLLR